MSTKLTALLDVLSDPQAYQQRLAELEDAERRADKVLAERRRQLDEREAELDAREQRLAEALRAVREASSV